MHDQRRRPEEWARRQSCRTPDGRLQGVVSSDPDSQEVLPTEPDYELPAATLRTTYERCEQTTARKASMLEGGVWASRSVGPLGGIDPTEAPPGGDSRQGSAVCAHEQLPGWAELRHEGNG